MPLQAQFQFIEQALQLRRPWPEPRIRLIVPFPAGGPTDIVARPLAQALGDALKATLVVDNRGGAGGSIGANAVAKSAPDGRTLLMATVGTQAINPALYKNLPYDAVRDFTPIALVAVAPVADRHKSRAASEQPCRSGRARETNAGEAQLSVRRSRHARSFDRRRCSSAAAGVDIQHVPYKGSAPAVTDLIGGQIQIMFDPLQSVLSNVQAGKLRAHRRQQQGAVARAAGRADNRRVRDTPASRPTAWWGVFAPAKLPADLAQPLPAKSNASCEARLSAAISSRWACCRPS